MGLDSYKFVKNLEINDFSKEYIKQSEKELISERDIVKDILKMNP